MPVGAQAQAGDRQVDRVGEQMEWIRREREGRGEKTSKNLVRIDDRHPTYGGGKGGDGQEDLHSV